MGMINRLLSLNWIEVNNFLTARMIGFQVRRVLSQS
jgi:hypothetical protein